MRVHIRRFHKLLNNLLGFIWHLDIVFIETPTERLPHPARLSVALFKKTHIDTYTYKQKVKMLEILCLSLCPALCKYNWKPVSIWCFSPFRRLHREREFLNYLYFYIIYIFTIVFRFQLIKLLAYGMFEVW